MRHITPIFLLLSLALSCAGGGRDRKDTTPTDLPDWMTNPGADANGFIPERQVRIIPLAKPMQGGGQWMANRANGLKKDYNAQDILEMVADLKPTTLERYFTGAQDMNKQVPVRAGYPPMTVKEFLNKSLEAAAPGCEIVPKLNLDWLANPKDSVFFWKCAEEIRTYDLIRPITNINLDCWDRYCKQTMTSEDGRNEMFKRLRKLGYTKIGVNMTGYIRNNENIDYCDISINKETWRVQKESIEKCHSFPNIKNVYLYIDYPGMTETFMSKDPDEQARIYYEEIYPFQRKYNFNYVYAIIQDFFAPGEIRTSENGPYGGKTLYDISKELLFKPYEK